NPPCKASGKGNAFINACFFSTLLGDSVNLAGNWRFHTGDDVRWAQPDFNDSQWRVITTEKPWSEQGISHIQGFFWYRLRVKLPSNHEPLNLFFNYSGIAYEVYANGKSIGQYGAFPPHRKTFRALPRKFAIPTGAVRGDSLTIAVRFWLWPRIADLKAGVWGGITGDRGLVLGTKRSIDDEYGVWQSHVLYGWLPDFSVRVLAVFLAIGLLVLYRLQPGHNEYLWIACYFVAMTAETIAEDIETIHPLTLQVGDTANLVLTNVAQFFMLQFVFSFLRLRMPSLIRVYQVSLLLQVVGLESFYRGGFSSAGVNILLYTWMVPYFLVVPLLVLWKYIRGYKEAGLIAIPLFLVNVSDILAAFRWLFYYLGWRRSSAEWFSEMYVGVIPVWIGQIEGLLVVLSIGALLMYRFHRTSQEEARAVSELEAAGSVQSLMLPQQEQKTPGFIVQSAYIPAQQVGGDFFQLFPDEDGSLLVVIGDVSGKGVKAAMLVSLIVGLLQKTAGQTRQPVQLLEDLNRELVNHMQGRFATCCCALLSADGPMLIANAGHLSPYCNGREIEVLGGLPLGLSADASYEQVWVDVEPGARLVFLSDGVVEARNKSGELYGFERSRVISTQPASEIARTAQTFGQEDDITLLGIERQVA
ncbi:MAG: serine/threonine-protein phosphatase, partial [Acidobacteriota bacterium]|nr:serine/threonine-protein phosphatase [Acidobacteriota bacterium]